jgi:hypothetical protein
VRDDLDTVAADCETVGGPPVDPPVDPPTDPPAGPPSSPPTGPTGPTGPTNPPVVIDRTAPTASLSMGTAHLGKFLSGGLKVSVRSNEAGTLGATLTAESTTARLLKKHGVKGVLASGKARATSGATKTLTLRLSRKARRALGGATVVKLKLVITVTDGAGNTRTLTRHLRIRS